MPEEFLRGVVSSSVSSMTTNHNVDLTGHPAVPDAAYLSMKLPMKDVSSRAARVPGRDWISCKVRLSTIPMPARGDSVSTNPRFSSDEW